MGFRDERESLTAKTRATARYQRTRAKVKNHEPLSREGVTACRTANDAVLVFIIVVEVWGRDTALLGDLLA